MVSAATVEEAVRAAGKRVRELCLGNLGGLKPSQVAVLAPASAEGLWPVKFATIPLTRDFEEWRRDKGVLIVTLGRFKGLEADAVVIVKAALGEQLGDDQTRLDGLSQAHLVGQNTAALRNAPQREHHRVDLMRVGIYPSATLRRNLPPTLAGAAQTHEILGVDGWDAGALGRESISVRFVWWALNRSWVHDKSLVSEH